jgi:hypothetical protein
MKINIKINSEKEFIMSYLKMSNLLLPVTSRLVEVEMEVIAAFALLPPKFDYQRFSPLAKKKVIEGFAELNRKMTIFNLNNRIHALVKKGFLRRDEDRVIYLPKTLSIALERFRKTKEFNLDITWQIKE